MRLEGQVAIVTGGASGIGAATCRRLAAEGAQVAVCDVNLEGAREVCGEIDGRGVRDGRDQLTTPCDRPSSGGGGARPRVDPRQQRRHGLVRLLQGHRRGAVGADRRHQPDGSAARDARGAAGHDRAGRRPDRERRLGGGPRRLERVGGLLGRQGRRDRVHEDDRARGRALRRALQRGRARADRHAAAEPGARPSCGQLGEKVVDTMVGSTALRRLGAPDEVAATIAFLCSPTTPRT